MKDERGERKEEREEMREEKREGREASFDTKPYNIIKNRLRTLELQPIFFNKRNLLLLLEKILTLVKKVIHAILSLLTRCLWLLYLSLSCGARAEGACTLC